MGDLNSQLKTRKIVISAILSAISILLGVTRFGFIPWIGGAAITIMHVPVIVGAIIEGPVVGMIIGGLFGIFSMIQAAVAPTGPIDIAFTNPVISVLPRILIGLTTWMVYRSFNKKWEVFAVILASIIGSLTNTIFVLGFLGLFKFINWGLIGTLSITNGIPEAIAAAVLGVAVILSWKKIYLNNKRSSLPDLPENPEQTNKDE